jgi:acyl-CoA reductase-like NAD-dependent aldehyde dehydrogenase
VTVGNAMARYVVTGERAQEMCEEDHNICFVSHEVFGPIRSVFKYKTVDEAIRRANNTSYGLGASVWGKDSDELQRVARQVEAGTVWINQHAIRNPFVPAGAYKNSGIGVEFGEEGLREFCHIQVITAGVHW